MEAQIEYLDPEDIQPPHEVQDEEKVEQLAASMREAADGWVGRPLVVWRAHGVCQALTGSHRLAAARLVMSAIPCLILTEEQATAAKLGWNTQEDWVASNLQMSGYEELAGLVAQG